MVKFISEKIADCLLVIKNIVVATKIKIEINEKLN